MLSNLYESCRPVQPLHSYVALKYRQFEDSQVKCAIHDQAVLQDKGFQVPLNEAAYIAIP